MPTPKPVDPVEPDAPLACPTADPGENTEAELLERQHETDENESGWIELGLVDEVGKPVVGERYKVLLPNGRTARGTLNELGLARIEGFPPGPCTITFPRLDKEAWASA
ncbi:MAG: hypothetical protein ACKVX7_09280 [Planctomycetota bacterium]